MIASTVYNNNCDTKSHKLCTAPLFNFVAIVIFCMGTFLVLHHGLKNALTKQTNSMQLR